MTYLMNIWLKNFRIGKSLLKHLCSEKVIKKPRKHTWGTDDQLDWC